MNHPRVALNRRDVLAGLTAAGVVPTFHLASTGRGVQADEGQATYFGWAGYDDENLWQAYVEQEGAAPEFTFWGDEEEGIAKMRAGFTPDVVFPCNYSIKKWVDSGMLQPVDVSRLSNWDDIIPALKDVPGSTIDGDHYWVPVDWGLTSILYRTDLAPEYVDDESWMILWDPKYKSQVAAFDSLVDGVVIAGIVAGLDNPFDYSTQDALDTIRPYLEDLTANLRYYSNDYTSMEQGLASGELVAATTWNESVVRLKGEGLPVAFMNPKEGAMTWVCGLSIATDSPYPDKAHALINAFLDPRSRAYEMEVFGYGAATQSAFDLVSEDVLAALGLSKNPQEILAAGIYQQPIQGESDLQFLFEEVKAGL